MSKSTRDGAASMTLSDDELEAAGARLHAEARDEARATLEAMARGWLTVGLTVAGLRRMVGVKAMSRV